MFERFTETAKQVIVLAYAEARIHKHHYLGTEHLLIALAAPEAGVASKVLTELNVSTERVRRLVVKIVGEGEDAPTGELAMTPRAKKVCELALREALSLGHNYIGTEHILIGLTRAVEGVAARILFTEMGLTGEQIRNQTIRALSKRFDARVAAGPAKPRDEAAIKRKMTVAITEADDFLRQMHFWNVMPIEVQTELRRVRGLLAEWRTESG